MAGRTRSAGVSFLAVCFVIFGILSAFSGLDYLLIKARHGGLSFTAYEKKIERYLDVLPSVYRAQYEEFRNTEDFRSFEAFFDDVMQSRPLNMLLNTTFWLALCYILLGWGIWHLRPWARAGTIGLHLALIPVHTFCVWSATEEIWHKLSERVPDLAVYGGEGFKNYFLTAVSISVFLSYGLIAAYLFLPKIKAQFQPTT